MKKSKLKKQSKQKISVIQRKLWKLCREIAIKRYEPNCYTCETKNLQGFNKQLGHMWAKASLGAYMKYDLRILRWQCMICNQFHGGRCADFYARMLKEIGQEAMEQLQKDRQVTVNAYDWYSKLLVDYQKILDELSTT